MDIERLSDDFADMLSARSSGGSVAAFEQIQGMLVEELVRLESLNKMTHLSDLKVASDVGLCAVYMTSLSRGYLPRPV